MQELIKRMFFYGSKRRISLYCCEPDPADSFIPEKDKLAILFQFSITKNETDSLSQLKKDLNPRVKLDHQKCMVEYRITSFGKKHYFEVLYHVYDYSYGMDLYNKLAIKYFE